VVILVIAIILAIALPGLSAMTTDSRFSAAVQQLNGVITRAQIESQADMNMTAVRIMPSAWAVGSADGGAPNRQTAVNYRYSGAYDPSSNFVEQLEPRPDTPIVTLPANIWAAPVEAVSTTDPRATPTLTGSLGQFRSDPANTAFLPSDDFLIVFDPQAGVRGSVTSGGPQPGGSGPRSSWNGFALRAYNADASSNTFGQEIGAPDGMRRYNYSGIVLYPREPFVALGEQATAQVRQELLQRLGRPYYVHRFGGGLVMGAP
jgi:type II secretory pathway pseudopilin PulG